jgi:hypothetical protein
MTRTRTVLAAALSAAVLAAASPAAAQEAGVVEGPGIKVGEGTVLHPVLGVESGVISNVFYEDADPTFAGLLRVIAEFGIGSLPDQRLTGAVAQSDPDADGEAAAKATNEGELPLPSRRPFRLRGVPQRERQRAGTAQPRVCHSPARDRAAAVDVLVPVRGRAAP